MLRVAAPPSSPALGAAVQAPRPPSMTERLYLEDAYCREFDALVTESADGWSRLSRTVFHPGGGGQPFDQGWISCAGTSHPVTGMREAGEPLWHQVGVHLEAGVPVHGGLDWPRRLALMRHHC